MQDVPAGEVFAWVVRQDSPQKCEVTRQGSRFGALPCRLTHQPRKAVGAQGYLGRPQMIRRMSGSTHCTTTQALPGTVKTGNHAVTAFAALRG